MTEKRKGKAESLNVARQRESNMPLVLDFMRFLGTKPELAKSLPKDAQVVVVPPDDPKVAAMNLKMAADIAAQGKTVVLVQWPIRSGPKSHPMDFMSELPFRYIGVGSQPVW